MNEEKQIQGTQTKGANENNEPGDIPGPSSLIDEANAAAERLERANKEKALLLAREEQLMAKQALGGRSVNPPQPEPPKELTPKEYVAILKRGIVPIENKK